MGRYIIIILNSLKNQISYTNYIMRSFAAIAALAATAAADNWAVIMAGSKGYSNYRH